MFPRGKKASSHWLSIDDTVREQTLGYTKTKKAKMLRQEEELEKKINILQRQIDSGCNNANEKIVINIQLEEKTKELEKIIEHRTKGAILRAKCRWYNEGEKNSKYFLNLEKRHFKNGVLTQLSSDNSAHTKKFCLNAKPFTEIFMVAKQAAMIHELMTYFLETLLFGNRAC